MSNNSRILGSYNAKFPFTLASPSIRDTSKMIILRVDFKNSHEKTRICKNSHPPVLNFKTSLPRWHEFKILHIPQFHLSQTSYLIHVSPLSIDLEEEVNRSPFAEGQDHSSLKALKLAVQSWVLGGCLGLAVVKGWCFWLWAWLPKRQSREPYPSYLAGAATQKKAPSVAWTPGVLFSEVRTVSPNLQSHAWCYAMLKQMLQSIITHQRYLQTMLQNDEKRPRWGSELQGRKAPEKGMKERER